MSKGSGGTRGSRPANNARVSGGNIGNNGINAKIASAEAAIRNNNFETAMFFDVNGNLLKTVKGGESEVKLGKGIPGSILTHNHPGVGVSFSNNDLIYAAKHGLKEIRATGKSYTFSAKPNVTSENPMMTAIRVQSAWNRHYAAVKSELKQSYTKHGRKYSEDQINLVGYHLVSKRVAKELGWEYTRTKTK